MQHHSSHALHIPLHPLALVFLLFNGKRWWDITKKRKSFTLFNSRWWCRLNIYSHNPSTHHSPVFLSVCLSFLSRVFLISWLTNFYDIVVRISVSRECLYANNHKDTHKEHSRKRLRGERQRESFRICDRIYSRIQPHWKDLLLVGMRIICLLIDKTYTVWSRSLSALVC